jgi:Uma2 family endonuclease
VPHRRIVSNLYGVVRDYQREHRDLIDFYGGGNEIRIWCPGMLSVRHPDLGIVFMNAGRDEKGNPRPDLVAEVVSASSRVRDYQTKREEYLAYGIREYWIVDPFQRRVTVLIRQGEGAEASWLEHTFEEDQVIASVVLPGLQATVADLWHNVRWDEL